MSRIATPLERAPVEIEPRAPGHKPSRTGHRVLRFLAEASERHTAGEMMAASVDRPETFRGRKFPYLIASMCRDGLIRSAAGLYWITDEGREALMRLDAGEAVVVGAVAGAPNVRVFAERRAA